MVTKIVVVDIIMLLVGEEQDSKCLLTSVNTIFFKALDMSCLHTRNFRLIMHFPHNYFSVGPVELVKAL